MKLTTAQAAALFLYLRRDDGSWHHPPRVRTNTIEALERRGLVEVKLQFSSLNMATLARITQAGRDEAARILSEISC